ncbi:MAG: HAD family phosphatase [Treponema sp.]|nr:HAD family phosphatase [Treponema sp.]
MKLPDSKLNIKLAAFDIDDTLINDEKRLSHRTTLALQEAVKKGIYVVLCSGRAENGILPYVRALNIAGSQQGRFLIAFNGAEIFDLHTRSEIYSQVLSPNIQKFVNQEAEKRGLAAITYDSSTIYAGVDSKWARADAELCNLNFEKISNYEAFLETPRHKMLVPASPKEVEDFREFLLKSIGDKVDVFISKPFFLEILPRAIGKGNAILWLCDHLKINPKEAICFGDSMNDESMLTNVGIGVAMKNAFDYIKDVATFTTRYDNNEDGVADFLEEFVL